MCGIIGCIGRGGDTKETLLAGLKNLEYRGYDSAGIAFGGETVTVEKREGELENLRRQLETTEAFDGSLGIGHTRWSTHGPPSDRNSHPHMDEAGRVAVVHNGIIENYQALRDELRVEGVEFTSDTDSEVVPHLIARQLDAGKPPEEAFTAAVERLDGSYALAAVVEGEHAIFTARNDSPLVIGVDGDATFVASDVPAFLEYTRDVVYLENGEYAVLRPGNWTVFDGASPVEKVVKTVEWSPEQTGKSGYDHFMLKEIHEQPTALRQCLRGRVDEFGGRFSVDELDELERPDAVQFVACGTSYHAALYAAELLRDAGVPAQAYLASEYALGPAPITPDTLVVGVTQSGETADTLSALREASVRGARTLALTNVVGSTAARECDHALYIRAGPEIGVAATKTFSSQLVALNVLVERLTAATGVEQTRSLISALRELPEQVQQVLDDSKAADVVDEFGDGNAFFFIGRGLDFPVALEGALKFKEITYEHAEGFAAGELKHGPLALVTENTPVFAVVTGDDERAQKTIGNVKEVESRGAPVIAVTDGQSDVERYADAVLEIPRTTARTAAMLANVQLQLVAYHTAYELDRTIDKPRNLAKSVTVE
ncbi:glutamine--fructose-6-phosphate transaminase (isomerizing) [Natronomonas sp. EA1]|uniref:glutamine--fructose-6-phosphate transaminase (isomerizing) n=1 Tax=Natronomonas sp. EA1 TaxID=3421655 RepID=UPI003EBD2AFA